MTIDFTTVQINADQPSNALNFKIMGRTPSGALRALTTRFSPLGTFIYESVDNGTTWDVVSEIKNGSSSVRLINPGYAVSEGGAGVFSHAFNDGTGNGVRPYVAGFDPLLNLVADVQITTNGPTVGFDPSSETTFVGTIVTTETVSRLLWYSGEPGSWTVEQVAVAGTGIDDIIYASFVYDNNNTPHIIFTNRLDADRSSLDTIWYTNRSGGSWSTPEQLKGDFAQHNGRGNYNLAVKPTGEICLFYASAESASISTIQLWYGERSTGGTWTHTLVSPTTGVNSNADVRTGVANTGAVWACFIQTTGASGTGFLVRRNPSGSAYEFSSVISGLGGNVMNGWDTQPRIGNNRKAQPKQGMYWVVVGNIAGGASTSEWHFIRSDSLGFVGEEDQPSCEAEPSRTTITTNDEGTSVGTISLKPDLVFASQDRFKTKSLRTVRGYKYTNAVMSTNRRRWRLLFNNRTKTDRDVLLTLLTTARTSRDPITFTHPISDESVVVKVAGGTHVSTMVNRSQAQTGIYVIEIEVEELLNTT